MAWTAINNNISNEILILYLSAIFWTLGYDTIYGAQDMSEDEIIGLKSTSIKFKKNMKLFVSITYVLSIGILSYLFNLGFGLNIFSLLFILFATSLIYQLKKFKKDNPKTCLHCFRLNNLSGVLLFLSILTIDF